MIGEEKIVDAIEEGKIVRVSEAYAIREGLPILRKKTAGFLPEQGKKKEEEEARLMMDDYRKPLKWGENKVVKDLVINFNWYVSRERRKRNLSRKQLAEAIGEQEKAITMIENGILPRDDFVLVNKIEEKFGISLRKNKDFSQEMRKLVEEPAEKEEKEMYEDKSDIV